MLGFLQAGAGVLDIIAGVPAAIGGGVACPETGIGCVVALGGVATTFAGGDNLWHGSATTVTGTYHPTTGAQFLVDHTPLSLGWAESIYSVSSLGTSYLNNALRRSVAAARA